MIEAKECFDCYSFIFWGMDKEECNNCSSTNTRITTLYPKDCKRLTEKLKQMFKKKFSFGRVGSNV